MVRPDGEALLVNAFAAPDFDLLFDGRPIAFGLDTGCLTCEFETGFEQTMQTNCAGQRHRVRLSQEAARRNLRQIEWVPRPE